MNYPSHCDNNKKEKISPRLLPSFMHHALTIPEILWFILSLCHKHTLASLARTCKAFHDPALDLLWIDQHSFITLLKLMPSDLWEIHPRSCIRTLVTFMFLWYMIDVLAKLRFSTFEGL